jgi:hypothetical protein
MPQQGTKSTKGASENVGTFLCPGEDCGAGDKGDVAEDDKEPTDYRDRSGRGGINVI